MNIILRDDPKVRKGLLPFTFTRPVAEIRIGILKIREKWEKLLNASYSFLSTPYLQDKYSLSHENVNTIINGHILPNQELVKQIKALNEEEALYSGNKLLAVKTRQKPKIPDDECFYSGQFREKFYEREINTLNNNYEIFEKNGDQIISDVGLIEGAAHIIEDAHTIIYNQENLWIEDDVSCRAAIINAEKGPVYIGKNAKIQEGAILEGPLSIGEGATISMGAKIRAQTTIGPYCKAGGEINNVVMFGYSNKAHDGFLGNSVIGEWCNLGADTNCSNLKNNYSNIKIWDFEKEEYTDIQRKFCGLLMGDHSKTGINTMLNTGTITGVCTNIIGAGFPAKFIPNFSWGGATGFEKFKLDKAFEMASRMMQRRDIELSREEKKILKYLYDYDAEIKD